MHDHDKDRCRFLIQTVQYCFPGTVNLVPIIMAALDGRANPAEVRDWIECDFPPGKHCGICSHWISDCDCAKTGRR